jgi:hypothetical protein
MPPPPASPVPQALMVKVQSMIDALPTLWLEPDNSRLSYSLHSKDGMGPYDWYFWCTITGIDPTTLFATQTGGTPTSVSLTFH